MSTDAIAELRERLGHLHDLETTAALLHWDMLVVMPPAGIATRGEQLATLRRVAHQHLISPELEPLLAAAPPGDDVARVARRDRDKARRVPSDLVAELARAAASGQAAWRDARARRDFGAFAPHLQRLLDLRRRYAACFPHAEHPYDALLDDFEPGMRTAEARAVLTRLRDGLLPLVRHCRGRTGPAEAAPLEGGPFEASRQRTLAEDLLRRVGIDPSAWRLDVSAHPFQASIALRDIRLTTRYDPRSLEALFSTLHEFGHGLYESQIDPSFARTPLQGGASMTVHESQSRLWENMVGRSRGFWRFTAPLLRERFPEAVGTADAVALWRAANVVRPSLIRVDADEVTYGLHIVLRFEIELELLEGTLAVTDVPDRWNAGIRELLGLEVPDVAQGALQDVHWGEGAFGYFPTYALGNVFAGQLWDAVRADLGDTDNLFERGEFAPLREWLRDRIHRHGRRYEPAELIRMAVGGPLDPEPLLRYLREKVEALHGPVPAISIADGRTQAA